MLGGINYLHAKFQINIFKKKVIKLLELWQLWQMKRKGKNSEYNIGFVIPVL